MLAPYVKAPERIHSTFSDDYRRESVLALAKTEVSVFGLGLAYYTDLTNHCIETVRISERVLILASDTGTVDFIKSINPNVENIYRFYREDVPRNKIYDEICEHIIGVIDESISVSILIYGHPTIYVNPIVQFLERCPRDKATVSVYPGCSAEDWLFAALEIDPSFHGWISYEATNFVLFDRLADSSTYLVLWQIGALGILTYKYKDIDIQENLRTLRECLEKTYSPTAQCVAFEASPYVAIDHRKDFFNLKDLEQQTFTKRSTLLIMPEKKPPKRSDVNQLMIQ
ncbi:hypothetical protein [Roseibium sp.]|uniref:hypothetical protein n=1 Tax=Roseibium sp. TaxID=1936156 RepID=UPI003A96D111